MVDPGQDMVACSFCGAALALDKPRGAERLILAHKKNNAAAEDALESFLLGNKRKGATAQTTEFAYLPFSVTEEADGKTVVAAASTAGALHGGTPYPPTGDYRFFDESCAAGEKIVPADKMETGTATIIHLPVYTIRYEVGRWHGRAAVIGESWQVIAEKLPPERPRAMKVGVFLGATGLFVAYLIIGRFASNFLGRLLLIVGASGGGYFLFSLHERVTKQE
jgi:hypothetical protein